MSTRNSRKLIDPCTLRGYDNISPYLSRLVNNIELQGEAVKHTAPDYIPYIMATEGGVAYIKSANEWVRFMQWGSTYRNGLLPRFVKLWSEDGHTWSTPIDLKRNDDIVIFPANAEFYPLANKIDELVKSLNTVEDNISQNLDNLRQLAVAVVRNNKLKNQITALNDLRRAGTTALGVISLEENVSGDNANINAVMSKTEAEEALTVVTLSPNAENYLMDYLELKKDYRQELNNVIGVSEVAEKTERRINSEMEMIENSTYSMIDLLCDSINKYATYYKVDIYAHRAHSACAAHVDMAVQESGAESKTKGAEEGAQNGNIE